MSPLIAVALLLAGCSSPAPQQSPQAVKPVAATASQPDLVLILIPGLRADIPGEPSAERALFEALGRTPARRFDAAYAQSIAAFVSAGSVLTGRYPSAIPMCGLYSDGRHITDERDRAWCAEIPEERYTLPETLSLYGYRTALFTAGFHGASVLSSEFQTWEDLNGIRPHRPVAWDDLAESVETWWAAGDGAPRFATLVLPELQLGCRPELLSAMGLSPALLPRGAPAQTMSDQGGVDTARVAEVYRDAGAAAGAGLRHLLSDLLDGAQSPGGRETWIAISSTNGYNLTGTTGVSEDLPGPFSTSHLLDRTARVPLALFGPAPERPPVQQVVELIDLFPTFAALAGAVPPAGLTGQDLLALETDDPQAIAYSEFGEFLLLRHGPWLLSFRSFQHHPSALDPELTELLLKDPPELNAYSLFNIRRDPRQREPLENGAPPELHRLRDELRAVRTGPGATPAGAMDARKLWELRMAPSQGYW